MTSPALTLARLKARQAALAREASRHPFLEQTPYREAEADLMNEEARLKLVIADMRGSETPEKSPKHGEAE